MHSIFPTCVLHAATSSLSVCILFLHNEFRPVACFESLQERDELWYIDACCTCDGELYPCACVLCVPRPANCSMGFCPLVHLCSFAPALHFLKDPSIWLLTRIKSLCCPDSWQSDVAGFLCNTDFQSMTTEGQPTDNFCPARYWTRKAGPFPPSQPLDPQRVTTYPELC